MEARTARDGSRGLWGRPRHGADPRPHRGGPAPPRPEPPPAPGPSRRCTYNGPGGFFPSRDARTEGPKGRTCSRAAIASATPRPRAPLRTNTPERPPPPNPSITSGGGGAKPNASPRAGTPGGRNLQRAGWAEDMRASRPFQAAAAETEHSGGKRAWALFRRKGSDWKKPTRPSRQPPASFPPASRQTMIGRIHAGRGTSDGEETRSDADGRYTGGEQAAQWAASRRRRSTNEAKRAGAACRPAERA